MPCGNNNTCTCYHDLTERANVFNCSGPQHTNITDILDNTPDATNWLILDDTNITELCELQNYLDVSITHLSLTSAHLNHICDDSLDIILATVTSLNMKDNQLGQISPRFNSRTSHLTEIWLGGNPIHCDCSMTWMIDFLFNSSLTTGSDLVKDYMDVICADPVYDGTPVYMLNPVKMGCYPKNLPIWIIRATASISAAGVVCMLILLLIYNKRNRVRWYVYRYTGKLIGADKQHDGLSGIEYDAFLSYRYSFCKLVFRHTLPIWELASWLDTLYSDVFGPSFCEN